MNFDEYLNEGIGSALKGGGKKLLAWLGGFVVAIGIAVAAIKSLFMGTESLIERQYPKLIGIGLVIGFCIAAYKIIKMMIAKKMDHAQAKKMMELEIEKIKHEKAYKNSTPEEQATAINLMRQIEQRLLSADNKTLKMAASKIEEFEKSGDKKILQDVLKKV